MRYFVQYLLSTNEKENVRNSKFNKTIYATINVLIAKTLCFQEFVWCWGNKTLTDKKKLLLFFFLSSWFNGIYLRVN